VEEQSQAARAAIIGADVEVPCVDGRARRYVNLDHAASTPAMAGVLAAVQDFLPWYSSVHRGSGYKSQLATAAYEAARGAVAEFVGARDGTVVLVRNTTEAINVLAAALPAGARVLSTAVEHHANMLPWRRHDVAVLPVPSSGSELVERCEHALRTTRPRIDLVAVTGASNVTGEVWPLPELAAVAHHYGAELFVDAAQLAPHRAIDMAATGIDYLALSGHKLYAPFGSGALVACGRALERGEPLMRGGGAIEIVTLDDVIWADAPERYEAGSPNVVGAVALGAACRILGEVGMARIAARERVLSARLAAGLASVPGLQPVVLWSDPPVDRVGLATFTLEGYRHPLLAAILSAEHAIGVRHGCFCAHPLLAHLLGVPSHELDRLAAETRAGGRPELPGAVRASFGLGTSAQDVDRLVRALTEIASSGPRWGYLHDSAHDEYRPAPEVRALPRMPRYEPAAASASARPARS
jgi:selenocysteine lyase/cysteine desulfurase